MAVSIYFLDLSLYFSYLEVGKIVIIFPSDDLT